MVLLQDFLLKNDDGIYNFKFYFFAFIASFMFGTKLVLISLAKCNEIWIFFIEHMGIWITCIVVISLTKGISKLCFTGRDAKKIFMCAFAGGAFNALGNVFIIFALKHAMRSGTSPATISTILMFNVLISLIAGLVIFREKHRIMKYVGGLIVFGSLILITTHRRIGHHREYTDTENESYYIAIC